MIGSRKIGDTYLGSCADRQHSLLLIVGYNNIIANFITVESPFRTAPTARYSMIKSRRTLEKNVKHLRVFEYQQKLPALK
jgi:hypothetical protein